MAGSVGKKASALVASDADKKRLAEKSFTSYIRAVQLMPNKEVILLYQLIYMIDLAAFCFRSRCTVLLDYNVRLCVNFVVCA